MLWVFPTLGYGGSVGPIGKLFSMLTKSDPMHLASLASKLEFEIGRRSSHGEDKEQVPIIGSVFQPVCEW
jgi:hypothetical protein